MYRKIILRFLSILLIVGMLLPLWKSTVFAATPNSTADATATLAYTLRGLPVDRAVQNFYIGETYLYITQRIDNVTYLSRLRIEGEEAYYMDQMVLTNWGHGEALDFYRYNGKEYFMVTSNGSDEYPKYYWSLQIARIEYEPGKTYPSYTGVKRFTNMKRATSDGSSLGGAYRVAACVNGDYTVFRIQVTSTKFVYSIYDTNKLNQLLDNSSPDLPSGDSTNYCLSMEDATAAYRYGITQEGSNRILPNNTFQGIELSSLDSIYLAGGAEGDTPQIARMTYKGVYAKLVNITNVGTHEIEGLQTDRGRVYFLIVTSTNNVLKKDTQKIYYVNESVFGINHSLVNLPGTKPTCTAEGLSDGATCTKCGQSQDVQERMPVIPHSYDLEECDPTDSADVLYFGFDNAPEDKGRYTTNPVYGGVNYDVAGALRTRNFYNGSANLDFPANSTQSFTNGTAKTVLTGPYATESSYAKGVSRRFIFGETNDTEASVGSLRYDPQNAQIFQLRFKLENLKVRSDLTESEQSRTVALRYYKNEETASVRNAYGYSGSYQTGDYMTVTIPLDESFTSADVITKLVVEFHGFVKADDSKEASLALDYVYVGPEASAPQKDYLYFGFDDSPVARHRYASGVYGGTNFDRLENWTYTANGLRMADGALGFSPNTEGVAYVQSGKSLHYVPRQEDYCQVSLRIEDAVGDQGRFSLLFATETNAITSTNCENIDFDLTDGHTLVLTFPLDSEVYRKATRINALRMQVENLTAAEGEIAKYRIDSLYIGPKNHLPAPLTCKEEGVTTYPCTHCGEAAVLQEIVPTEQHSYTYAPTSPSHHTVTCEACGLSQQEAHSYANGLCICGEAEIKEPIEDASLKLNHSLNLASDISVNLVLSKSALAGFDMETVYVESVPENGKIVRISPVENGNYYYFTVTGLTALNMNDRILSVLHGTKNGQPYYSPVDDYAIADYAYAVLSASGINSTMKTLCADLLRYGAKAQIYKTYRTDNLADSKMTEAHKAYLSDMESVTFGNVNQILDDVANAPITWAGKTLNLESKVALKFVFNPTNYSGELSDLTLRVSYKDINGNDKHIVVETAELYSASLGYYVFTVDTLLAAELRVPLSVQIYSGNTPVSCTMQFSADTYGNNQKGDLLTLCKALLAYSDSAKAYFTK